MPVLPHLVLPKMQLQKGISKATVSQKKFTH